MGPTATLSEFLAEAGVALTELYANKRSFTSLRQVAFGGDLLAPAARTLLSRLRALLHVNDPERLAFLRAVASESPLDPRSGERHARLAAMAAAALLDSRKPADAFDWLEVARDSEGFRRELGQLLDVLEDTRRDLTFEWRDPARLRPVPLHVHARYRQEEVLAALRVSGDKGIPRLQAGVFYDAAENLELLFVTLKKTAAGFSPKTMYRDYAISPVRFHWETQHSAHAGSPTGRRYLAKTSTPLLFVRETQEQPNGIAEPYWFLGPVELESASGERPMQIVWRLAHPMPGHLYQRATLAAG
jgi:hypothetical protein